MHKTRVNSLLFKDSHGMQLLRRPLHVGQSKQMSLNTVWQLNICHMDTILRLAITKPILFHFVSHFQGHKRHTLALLSRRPHLKKCTNSFRLTSVIIFRVLPGGRSQCCDFVHVFVKLFMGEPMAGQKGVSPMCPLTDVPTDRPLLGLVRVRLRWGLGLAHCHIDPFPHRCVPKKIFFFQSCPSCFDWNG